MFYEYLIPMAGRVCARIAARLVSANMLWISDSKFRILLESNIFSERE